MFILSSVSSGLEFWLVNDTSIYENSELKVFKNIAFFGEIFSNRPNALLGTKVYKTVESCLYYKTSIISRCGTFSLFSSLVIKHLILPTNFIVSCIKSSRQYPVFILNLILFSMLYT